MWRVILTRQDGFRWVYNPGEAMRESIASAIEDPELATYLAVVEEVRRGMAVLPEDVVAALESRDSIGETTRDDVLRTDRLLLSTRDTFFALAPKSIAAWRRRFKPPRSRWWWWLDQLTNEDVKEIEQRLR